MNNFIMKDKNNVHMYEGDTVKYTTDKSEYIGRLVFFGGIWLGLEHEDGERITFTPYGISSEDFELLLSEVYED